VKVMPVRNILRVAGLVLSVLAVIFCGPQPVGASVSQEDPDLATPVYDGISLFDYYSATLDQVVARQPDEVRTALADIPFANMPDAISDTTGHLSDYILNIAASLVQNDADLAALNTLLTRSQLAAAADLKAFTLRNIGTAESVLNQMQNAVTAIGSEFQVAAAPADSALRAAYDGVIARITKIRDQFTGTRRQLESIEAAKPLTVTGLTLDVIPLSAYVGDTITVSGMLESGGQPLSGREVTLLFNGSPALTAVTDFSGGYRAALTVPYIYSSPLNVQTAYYPSGRDVGVYLAAASPAVPLTVLFYAADLSLRLPEATYPGRDVAVAGTFDYDTSPVPASRTLEVYLDNIQSIITTAGEEFSFNITLTGIIPGNHTITVASPASGRYAPAHASAVLSVTQLVPVLDLQISSVSFIPGNLRVTGTLSSVAGPLQNAAVSLTLGKTRSLPPAILRELSGRLSRSATDWSCWVRRLSLFR